MKFENLSHRKSFFLGRTAGSWRDPGAVGDPEIEQNVKKGIGFMGIRLHFWVPIEAGTKTRSAADSQDIFERKRNCERSRIVLFKSWAADLNQLNLFEKDL